MNLEINTTPDHIKSSVKCKDRVNALLNPPLLPPKPHHKFKMVASGTPNDNCGELSAILKCEACAETHPVNHHCDRLECPTCYKTAAARIGKRSSSKIRSAHEAFLTFLNPESAKDAYGRTLQNTHLDAEFSEQKAKLGRIAKGGGLRHETISVPKRDLEKWEEFSNIQITKALKDHMAEYCPRVIADESLYHPHRIKPEILKQLKTVLSRKSNKAEKRKRKRERNNKLQKALRSSNNNIENFYQLFFLKRIIIYEGLNTSTPHLICDDSLGSILPCGL